MTVKIKSHTDKRNKWTEERTAKLVELRLQMKSNVEIAHELGDGLTRAAVMHKLGALGLGSSFKMRRSDKAPVVVSEDVPITLPYVSILRPTLFQELGV